MTTYEEAQPHPLEVLTDERIEALVERDWDKYNEVGRRIVEYLDQRSEEEPRI